MLSGPASAATGSGMHSPSVKMPGRSGCGSVRGETTISATPSRNSRGTSPASRTTMASKSARRMRGQSRPIRSATKPATWSSPTRSCCIESRWRTVTVRCAAVSPSTVMPNGVPASSIRR